jgi:hypothetical protein
MRDIMASKKNRREFPTGGEAARDACAHWTGVPASSAEDAGRVTADPREAGLWGTPSAGHGFWRGVSPVQRAEQSR